MIQYLWIKEHGIELLEIIDKMYHDGFLKIKQKRKNKM